MNSWGSRYSVLFQEPPSAKSTPTPPSMVPTPFATNQAAEYNPVNYRSSYSSRHPPNSSIFVASLPFSILPHEMHEKLKNLISQFIEPLEVKIIKDKLGNQAAFVQAKSSGDAAFLLDSHLFLEGKLLRMEPARAHRTLVLSFKDSRAAPCKLRLLRNALGYLRAIVNEVTPIEGWVPLHKDDQFSGPGHLFSQFAYNESCLKKLCELLGPVEEFRRVHPSIKSQKSDMKPHPPSHEEIGNYLGPWEVKWVTRDDAMRAKSLLTGVPFISWSWAHNLGQAETPYRNETRNYPGALSAGAIQHMNMLSQTHHTFSDKNVPENMAVNGKNTFTAKGQSLKLAVDDFPPLVTDHRTPRSEKVHGKHERTVSEDTETPITPESLHHASPEVANMSGEDEKTKLDVTQEISTKSTPPFSAEYPQDDVSQGPNPAYDKSTLYVSGIPQGSDEKQIRQLFSGYGQLKHVRLVANHRGEFFSAFLNFDTVGNAATAMQAADEKPFTIGLTKIRVRYKRLHPPGRFRGRGRISSEQHIMHKAEPVVDNVQIKQVSEGFPQESVPKKVARIDENKNDGGKETSTTNAPLVLANETVEESVIENIAIISTPIDADTQPSKGTPPASGQVPIKEVPSGASAHVKDTIIPASESTLKPSYYGYYGAPSFPPNYPQHWGYPYPMYGPVYPFHPYSHPYWYPPGAMPLPAAYMTPPVPGNNTETPRIDSLAPPPYGPFEHPSFVSTRAPVAPAGSYQNPDGGITYVYPTEIIEKYMNGHVKSGGKESVDSYGRADSSQPNSAVSGQQLYGNPSSTTSSPLRPHYSQDASDTTGGYDVNPVIAAAVYRNYPPLPPPPTDKMPQGSFVFNPQGVIQHVEPAAYGPGGRSADQPGSPSESGLGLVQAAVAVVANGYHPFGYPSPGILSPSTQDVAPDLQSTSSRYSSPVSASSPYYYPQNGYQPGYLQMGPNVHVHPEYSPSGMGGRGGYKRRATHVMPRPAYPGATAGPGIEMFNGAYHQGGHGV